MPKRLCQPCYVITLTSLTEKQLQTVQTAVLSSSALYRKNSAHVFCHKHCYGLVFTGGESTSSSATTRDPCQVKTNKDASTSTTVTLDPSPFILLRRDQHNWRNIIFMYKKMACAHAVTFLHRTR